MRAAVVALGVLGCEAPEEILGVAYDERWGERTTMDVYLPAGGSSPDPAVLLIHGGGWAYGSKEVVQDAARRFARSGFAAVAINYRLVPDHPWPAAAQDAVCALSFLRANADEWNVDPDRIAVMGYSAGGHLSALLAVAADDPAIAADCDAGPTGLPAAAVPAAFNPDFRGEDADLVQDFLGGSEDEIPEVYEIASPITHVRPGLPPFLFVHGEDDVVDIGGSIEMRGLLRQAGNEANMLVVEGGGYLLNPSAEGGDQQLAVADDAPESWLAIVDFLDRTIGKDR